LGANDRGAAIDVLGAFPGGANFNGVEGLEKAPLERPELFASTITEKLLTYAPGRGVKSHAGDHQIVAEPFADSGI
jgi:hypothetical protein